MDEHLKILFTKIIEDNKQRILRICRAYSHNIEDQKDLYQETALNIWKSLPSFRKEAMIGTWVYRVCLNVCMQHSLKLRTAKNKRVEIEGLKISDETTDMNNNLENKEKLESLYMCIAKLSEVEKSLILLFLEDLPYKMISDVTGITENHIAVKLSRIKKKLFNCINN
jgi:RNA polymerase sigma-70 factor (ECF subfamily)